ncbi:MAG: TetR family transcriptional regulator [Thermoleophilaceae bacterium]
MRGQGDADRGAARVRSRRTREALLDNAQMILERNGFAGLAMSAVAARAGVTRRAAYLHFASRSDLVAGLFECFSRCGPLPMRSPPPAGGPTNSPATTRGSSPSTGPSPPCRTTRSPATGGAPRVWRQEAIELDHVGESSTRRSGVPLPRPSRERCQALLDGIRTRRRWSAGVRADTVRADVVTLRSR